ncbi:MULTISPECIES: nucleotidyltransferase family protein [unclassified Caulobacter]|uniref:nucleotidyltransferase family protein n=1 Tax=unclassified Caulobacter TaxID=2648921 RepID=UPI0006F6F8D1|nr:MULTISPECIES: nucleotidyltransferase family protein [unclassified Caulobacter]KQV56078.1 hypothetical protein ASC62_19440 [Caulobacter sp. Root342]KQV70747.1 hypothetical protein ASC70_03815 [Caulobacter sp. Root343]
MISTPDNTNEHIDFDAENISEQEVSRRFKWAKRQGNPAWLWPDIRVEDWRAALEQVARVASAVLSGAAVPPRLDGDPAAIGLAGYTSGLGPLLGWWAETGAILPSPAVARVLDLHLRHNRIRAARLDAAAVDLIGRLSRQGIAVTVLKGADTGRAYFPAPGVRPASDIDLLVRAEQASAAEAILRAEGFAEASRGARESSWRPPGCPTAPRSLTLVHADDPWSIDLHSALDLMVSAGAPLAALDAGAPMDSRRAWAPGSEATALEQPLLLFHLAIHAGAGLQNLTLLRLVELNLVIRQDVAAGRLSWDAFLALGERIGLLGFAYPALTLCEALTPGVVPALVLARCARATPRGVLRVVRRLTPATAQRIERSSVGEHFMWTDGWRRRIRQLAADIAPRAGSWRALWSIYEKRAWRLVRGRVSR